VNKGEKYHLERLRFLVENDRLDALKEKIEANLEKQRHAVPTDGRALVDLLLALRDFEEQVTNEAEAAKLVKQVEANPSAFRPIDWMKIALSGVSDLNFPFVMIELVLEAVNVSSGFSVRREVQSGSMREDVVVDDVRDC
jgi:hypothetical protein